MTSIDASDHAGIDVGDARASDCQTEPAGPPNHEHDMQFPHHAIPDGTTWAPHHVYIGVLVTLVALLVLWDDARRSESWLLLAALFGATFAFALVWQHYAAAGAVLTLTLLVVALSVPLFGPFWRDYPLFGWRGVAIVGVLLALDDAIEHAFGWPMPADWFWKAWLHGAIT
ncbi:hypothetical protein [Halorarum salinum]|uniref:Uncharacterized protein n=1 Tax=Halorarum salinum TaxID=2743089 RepID=A0A7D5L9T2_9EURY|nr:hypothetical protein [Halobaculum salinum]QLG61327.1 hypothetical protein HUG12_06090 [Halobaculum salinum]